MRIILFSRENIVIDHWKEKLNSSDFSKHSSSKLSPSKHSPSKHDEIISCLSFAELGEAISDENHILLFHLAQGDTEENICYQFITKYQQQQKMLVFVNKPDPAQGLRLFRSGVHGYSNTYLGKEKLLVAINVIEQGKIWIGAETLNRLLNDCGLDTKNSNKESSSNEVISNEVNSSKEKKNNLLKTLFMGVKKLFS
jgi:hypothetical protein